jgi:hypothetical protein
VLTNVDFTLNQAISGGGIDNDSAGIVMSGGFFSDNQAITTGGGLYLYNNGTGVRFNDVEFIYNIAANGGGIYNGFATPALEEVIFRQNIASGNGGGMYNNGGAPHLTNVGFLKNRVTGDAIADATNVVDTPGKMHSAVQQIVRLKISRDSYSNFSHLKQLPG